ncbi:dihydrofolate reductase family protein [Planomicrobium sp. CPCC 101110]|uniref:dihydrofolate reductase family protein n=1 Tax=Planomicrobium sp. CPCC 101110 TaxID=2599619 RepID=UPI0011B73474|nr:dihydrofolate reductase family protein [Planomicrobium sp. CPCC 101110]TWT24876.1 dihydrofolate reductase [Planomicrobium sp. CPCC 101110]
MPNQRRIVCYIAISLDGYIATEDDSLEWLFKVEGEGDAGYGEFIKTIDTVVMGRRTYDWVMEAEGGKDPYPDKECYVFSTTEHGRKENVKYTDEEILPFAERLRREPGKDIWVVGGGSLLHGFLKEKLIDEFIISIAPTLIGKGIPLFQELDFQIDYRLKSVRQFGQFAQLHYELKK